MHLLSAPSRASSGVVRLKGGQVIHDVTYGSGPTKVIMFHGLGGEHGIYRWPGSLADALGLTLLFPWLPCHGPSSDTDNFEEAVGFMTEYREQRGAVDSLVIGHSFGGALATALCAERGRTLAMAAPIDPRFLRMTWAESQMRLGWVGLDLLGCIAAGALESLFRLDACSYFPAVAGTLFGGHRIGLGIRVLRSMPNLTPAIHQANSSGRVPLRLWGLADFGVQPPPVGLLPGGDWYLPWVRHGDFALRLGYPYPMIRRGAAVQLGRADPLHVPFLTHSAA